MNIFHSMFSVFYLPCIPFNPGLNFKASSTMETDTNSCPSRSKSSWTKLGLLRSKKGVPGVVLFRHFLCVPGIPFT